MAIQASHMVIVLVGGPCGLSLLSRRMLNVWRSASVTKMSTVTSCIVKSATTLQWTVRDDVIVYEFASVSGIL